MVKLKLNSEENQNLYRGMAGIYFLILDGEIVYIGQSQNIGKRLSSHNSRRAFDRIWTAAWEGPEYAYGKLKALYLYYTISQRRDDFEFAVYADESMSDVGKRDELEEYLISVNQPRFNFSGVNIPYYRCSKSERDVVDWEKI